MNLKSISKLLIPNQDASQSNTCLNLQLYLCLHLNIKLGMIAD